MSNRDTMIKKYGSEEEYKAFMRSIAAKPHKRGGPHTVQGMVKKIQVKAEEHGVPIEVFVKKKLSD